MARSKRFKQGVVLAFAGQVLTMVTGLWLSPFLLHQLGRDVFGLWIVGQQILVYLTLMDLGVIALLPRETAYASGRLHPKLEVGRLASRTLRIILLQTPMVGLIAAGLWAAVPHKWALVKSPIGLAAVTFTVLFPFRIFRGLLHGLQDLAFLGWSYLGGWLAGVALSISSVYAGFGLHALVLGWAASQFTDSVLCFIRLRRDFRFALPHLRIAGNVFLLREQFARGLWISISQVAQVLIYGTDAAIIGRLFGSAAVVPYNSTGKLIGVLANQPQNIMRSAESGLSEMRVTESRERLQSVTGALGLAMLLASGFVVTLTLAVNQAFVGWWIGADLYSGALLTLCFALCMALRHLNITAIYTLFSFGHERWLAVTALADGVLSTALSIVLASLLHSPLGVVLGSILSTGCVLFLGNAPRLSRVLGISLGTLGRPLYPWFWRMLLIGTAASVAGSHLREPNPFVIASVGALISAIYVCLMFPVARESALWPHLEPTINRLLSFTRPLTPAPPLAKAARSSE